MSFFFKQRKKATCMKRGYSFTQVTYRGDYFTEEGPKEKRNYGGTPEVLIIRFFLSRSSTLVLLSLSAEKHKTNHIRGLLTHKELRISTTLL